MSTDKKITIYENALIGNFGGDSEHQQQQAAYNYQRILTDRINEYLNENYPDYEHNVEIELQYASGYSREIETTVECSECLSFSIDADDCLCDSIKSIVENNINSIICDMERTGEIYE